MTRRRINFSIQWEAAGNDSAELYHTMARFSFTVNEYLLTRNEDAWSRTVKDDVLVSLFPLATWFASSWWRLLHEPHPNRGVRPSSSWRMAHELSAANHGFVWPTVMFATDGEGIHVWSSPSDQNQEQSVRYLNGSRFPSFVPLDDFRREVSGLIGAVLDRLRDTGHAESELSQLWNVVCEEAANPEVAKRRSFEAMMGYDPEDCPEELLRAMLTLSDKVGDESLAELMSAMATGGEFQQRQEQQVKRFSDLKGLEGKPDIPEIVPASQGHVYAPWMLAVQDAKAMRDHLGQGLDPISDEKLFDSLGISGATAKSYTLENTSRVSVAIPEERGRMRFMPRKKHPTARRFEFARLLADCIFQQQHGSGWLVSSDLSTFRQKYQRAFAAELLCPVDGVKQLMQEDYSESAIEDTAEHFGVSTTTVASLLANNGLIESDASPAGNGCWPYLPMAASG